RVLFRSQHSLGEDGAGNNISRNPGFFTRVEHAQVQKHQGIRNQRKRREGQRESQKLSVIGGEIVVLEQPARNRNAKSSHENDDWNQRNKGQFRSEEHTSELQSRFDLVCRLLLEKINKSKRPGFKNTNTLITSPAIFTIHN